MIALPLAADVSAALAGNPRATAALSDTAGDNFLALVQASDGFATSVGHTGDIRQYASELSLDVDLTGLTVFRPLSLTLLNPEFIGVGFESLRLTVDLEARRVLDQTFSDPSSAITFLDDQVLTFGQINQGVTGLLDVDVRLELRTLESGSGFHSTMLVANAPEPGAAAIGSLAAVICSMRRRRPCYFTSAS